MKKRLLILGAVIVLLIPVTMCNVHYGNPQAVWFYCSMLGWCAP